MTKKNETRSFSLSHEAARLLQETKEIIKGKSGIEPSASQVVELAIVELHRKLSGSI